MCPVPTRRADDVASDPMQGADRAAGAGKDPAELAQSLFEQYEERHHDDAPPPPVAIVAAGPAAVDKAELQAVVASLEVVTSSLIATSEALAAIAASLAD
jgi:hypothetical protein